MYQEEASREIKAKLLHLSFQLKLNMKDYSHEALLQSMM
jgi:hypothetical protein